MDSMCIFPWFCEEESELGLPYSVWESRNSLLWAISFVGINIFVSWALRRANVQNLATWYHTNKVYFNFTSIVNCLPHIIDRYILEPLMPIPHGLEPPSSQASISNLSSPKIRPRSSIHIRLLQHGSLRTLATFFFTMLSTQQMYTYLSNMLYIDPQPWLITLVSPGKSYQRSRNPLPFSNHLDLSTTHVMLGPTGLRPLLPCSV